VYSVVGRYLATAALAAIVTGAALPAMAKTPPTKVVRDGSVRVRIGTYVEKIPAYAIKAPDAGYGVTDHGFTEVPKPPIYPGVWNIGSAAPLLGPIAYYYFDGWNMFVPTILPVAADGFDTDGEGLPDGSLLVDFQGVTATNGINLSFSTDGACQGCTLTLLGALFPHSATIQNALKRDGYAAEKVPKGTSIIVTKRTPHTVFYHDAATTSRQYEVVTWTYENGMFSLWQMDLQMLHLPTPGQLSAWMAVLQANIG
jgi:hypothetical protein